jgi:TolB protein
VPALVNLSAVAAAAAGASLQPLSQPPPAPTAIVEARSLEQKPSPPLEQKPSAGGQALRSQTALSLARNRLAFSSDRTGNQEIYLISEDGSQARQLTNDPRYESFWARISPDRQRILFYRRPAGVRGENYIVTSLWMINADGSSLRELRPVGTDGWELQGHAEWSPDGRQLVMGGGPEARPQLFITDADGTHPRQVTQRGAMAIDPSWSPDGSRLVFVSRPTSTCPVTRFEIFTMPVDGGPATQLTNDSYRDHDPYYSPDGRFITWSRETDPDLYAPGIGAWNMLLMRVDGADQRRLTDDRNLSAAPRWAVDGSRIFFHRLEVRSNPRWSVFSIRPDGSGLAEVTPNAPGNSEFPSG